MTRRKIHAMHDTDDRRTQCGRLVNAETQIGDRPTCRKCAAGLRRLWANRGG